ncbi:hypothetical protein HMPREF7215_1380 [Pyramidobacter piscolens W5455]|uniref:Uncharacterized protein n=1 Tax=Pyramidobacter piscolens W5455 TaxID=352165 RepID=A0ABM9ZY58_9BACT|nr:hypothetical protein HMPREF7215_1380 [Pyramidobacter piscolens W5455]
MPRRSGAEQYRVFSMQYRASFYNVRSEMFHVEHFAPKKLYGPGGAAA